MKLVRGYSSHIILKQCSIFCLGVSVGAVSKNMEAKKGRNAKKIPGEVLREEGFVSYTRSAALVVCCWDSGIYTHW